MHVTITLYIWLSTIISNSYTKCITCTNLIVKVILGKMLTYPIHVCAAVLMEWDFFTSALFLSRDRKIKSIKIQEENKKHTSNNDIHVYQSLCSSKKTSKHHQQTWPVSDAGPETLNMEQSVVVMLETSLEYRYVVSFGVFVMIELS